MGALPHVPFLIVFGFSIYFKQVLACTLCVCDLDSCLEFECFASRHTSVVGGLDSCGALNEVRTRTRIVPFRVYVDSSLWAELQIAKGRSWLVNFSEEYKPTCTVNGPLHVDGRCSRKCVVNGYYVKRDSKICVLLVSKLPGVIGE